MSLSEKITYLDYAATTPIDPSVIDAMTTTMKKYYGNPSSTHLLGWEAQHYLKKGRQSVADLIGSSAENIIFNSGATEGNNTILHAVAEKFSKEGCHIITSEIEHKCILAQAQLLEKKGCTISYLPVDQMGNVKIQKLPSLITPTTRLISIMGVNNETGVIQDLKSAIDIAHQHNIWIHSDCAQWIGKLPFDLNDLPLDFMSLSSHKLYGPRGMGALYAKHPELLRQFPLLRGGSQEFGTRAGTVNLPGIMGFAQAATITQNTLKEEYAALHKMKTKFISKLKTSFPDLIFNGSHETEKTVPGILNFRIPGIPSKDLMAVLKNDIALSTGSACTSFSQEPSHVLQAMGLSRQACAESLRLSFGRFTPSDQLLSAVEKISCAAKKLQGT